MMLIGVREWLLLFCYCFFWVSTSHSVCLLPVSYISTTTIGLGDIFLEPEVILKEDLYFYPLSMLVGFTLFSAFLGKLAESIQGTQKQRGFYETMLHRIEMERESDKKEETTA